MNKLRFPLRFSQHLLFADAKNNSNRHANGSGGNAVGAETEITHLRPQRKSSAGAAVVYGGSIRARNHNGGGLEMEIYLPVSATKPKVNA